MKAILYTLALLVSAQAFADTRIRTEVYDPTVVYNVYAKVGYDALLQLEADEVVSGAPDANGLLGMGNGSAWTMKVRANNIVFKPTAKQAETNMLIVTNKRTYAVDLRVVGKEEAPTYILRFTYPAEEAARRVAAAAKADADARKAQAHAEAVTRDKGALNTNYSWRGGNALLKPTAAWDDGRFTRLVYDHAGELPVFFKVLPDGTEALVNSNVDPADGSTIVLHEVVRTVRARLNDDVIEIVNDSYKVPAFNRSGTSEAGTTRVELGGVQ